MSTFGTKIAELRKAKLMTQEDLAAILGVSAQSISKWENGVSMPDILLLPLIADTFGVSIDALFRTASPSAAPLRFDEVPEAAHAAMIRCMAESFLRCDEECCTDEKIREYEKEMRNFHTDGAATAVCTDHGEVAYASKRLGLIIRRIDEQGMEALLEHSEAAALLSALASENVRKLLALILKNSDVKYTVPSFAKKLGIGQEEAKSAADTLAALGFLSAEELTLDEETPILLYSVMQTTPAHLIYGILACAAEAKNSSFYGYRGTWLENL